MATVDRLNDALSSLAIKAPCKAGTTGNITLSGLQAVDGVNLSQDDRVLVKDQTAGTDNGIYLADTGTWNRAPDFDGNLDVAKGCLIKVTDGTTNGDTFWQLDQSAVSIGSTSLTFSQPSLAGISAFMATVVDNQTEAEVRSDLGLVAGGNGDIWVEKGGDEITGVPDNDSPQLKITGTLSPSQTSGITGSVGKGALYALTTRSGGFGSYGNILSEYLVTDSVGSGEFDVGITSWVTGTNLASGQLFGMWSGSNTPSVGETFSGGAAIGQEINVGNRWADFGLQSSIGGTRYTVGLQIVPDVLPTSDTYTASVTISNANPAVISWTTHGLSADVPIYFTAGSGVLPASIVAGTTYYVISAGLTADQFEISTTIGGAAVSTAGESGSGTVGAIPSWPGSFGIAIAKSIHDHRWWTGILYSADSVMDGGYGIRAFGGSTISINEPNAFLRVTDYWQSGLDFADGFFSASLMLFPGGTQLDVTDDGSFGVSTTGSTPTGNLYANNFANRAMQWGWTGSATKLAFHDGTMQTKPAITGSTGANAALQSLLTALENYGLITDSTT